MSQIERYVLVDKNDDELAGEYGFLSDAIEAASVEGEAAVVARIYEYSDTELVWTPDGSDTWPPKKEDNANTNKR